MVVSFLLQTRLLRTLAPYVTHFTYIAMVTLLHCIRERMTIWHNALFYYLIKINVSNKDPQPELVTGPVLSRNEEDKGRSSSICSQSSFTSLSKRRNETYTYCTENLKEVSSALLLFVWWGGRKSFLFSYTWHVFLLSVIWPLLKRIYTVQYKQKQS